MKRDLIKQISLRVIIFIVAAAILSIVGTIIIRYKTETLEAELANEMEADMVFHGETQPVIDETDSTTTEYNTEPTDAESSAEPVTDTTEDSTTAVTDSDTTTAVTDSDTTADETAEMTDSDSTAAMDTAEQETESGTDDEAQTDSSNPSKTTTVSSVEQTEKPAQTTVAPTTPAPTTMPAPTTPAPTTPAPTTPAPTTVPPTTPAPTTAAPKPVENPVPINVSESQKYATAQQLQLFESRLLQDINALRSSMGLGQLSINNCLTSGSIVRSTEIGSVWSHTRPNGERGIYVLAACGGWYKEAINALINGTPYDCAFGENLAVVYGASDYVGSDQEIIALADEMFESWKASPTHYQNMVYAGFRYIGIGTTVDMDDVFHAFWTCTLFSAN